jgi:AraC-like DNA-binding protein
MIRLISALRHRLISSGDAQGRQQILDDFLAALALELRSLLLQPGQAQSSTASHVVAAIRWLDDHLAETITLPRLAAELGLTPRAVQACFRNRLGVSPMRWLKLARFSQLRRHLHDPSHRHRSSQQLKTLVGLSSNSLNRQAYREIYGLSPAEDQHQAQLHDYNGVNLSSDDQSFHFHSLEAAIAGLQALQQPLKDLREPALVSITVTVSAAPNPGVPVSQP